MFAFAFSCFSLATVADKQATRKKIKNTFFIAAHRGSRLLVTSPYCSPLLSTNQNNESLLQHHVLQLIFDLELFYVIRPGLFFCRIQYITLHYIKYITLHYASIHYSRWYCRSLICRGFPSFTVRAFP